MRGLRLTKNLGVIPKRGGSKPQFLSFDERLGVLSYLALQKDTQKPNPVEVIKEINRMTGAYPPTQHQIAAKVIFEVIYVDR